MSYIFRVNQGEPEKIQPVSFATVGINERNDLEAWVVGHPDLLEENLLIITTEFDRFERSNKRLDVLALDSDGVLVIIELKLDLSKTLADLQAIRYAAFCSTMTMNDVIRELARYEEITDEQSETKIRDFLKVDELPEIGNRPRIILAAGSIEDQELTASVLWLRNFGVDISCVELTPYKLEESIILVPRTIIPIPEAEEYQIRVQKKADIAAGRQWNKDTLFQELESRRGIEEAQIAERILEWAAPNLPRFWWGKGKNDGSVFPILDYNGIDYYPFAIWTYGKIEIQFQWLQRRPPFDNEAKRRELLDQLNKISGIDIPIDAIVRRPNIPLSVFKKKESLDQFIEILDWIVKEIKAS